MTVEKPPEKCNTQRNELSEESLGEDTFSLFHSTSGLEQQDPVRSLCCQLATGSRPTQKPQEHLSNYLMRRLLVKCSFPLRWGYFSSLQRDCG
ncbi:hypothetical protein Y1Q_0002268 [Alligator mississippiensis]|uniref:Uncharacterized protein n=1 Tax=Alligator mississippiensis TaxID=8496 RepID=A0A151MGJ8_ALLMI|nr:hypothetical protein Y1Q_0002268 [Alligator mississippiensis]